MKPIRLPFINVGFEFTASPHAKKGTDKEYFNDTSTWSIFYESIFGDTRLDNASKSESMYRYKQNDLPSKFKWIDDNYESDECGCEVATPIIKKLEDVTKYYKSFKAFTNKYGFTTNVNLAECGLGGCHIHLDLSWIKDKELKRRLVSNIGLYLTNNPQLNWAFNDVNDNINANNLLLPNSKRLRLRSITNFKGNPDYLKPFLNDRFPYRAFILNPLITDLFKNYCVRYNEDYDTVEFRIFDMPNDLDRHLLHYDVAMAIYKHCYKLSVKRKMIKPKFMDGNQVIQLKQNKALVMLKQSMKELGIAYKRVKDLEDNIATRYEWTTFKVTKKGIQFDFDNCYLL
jgi:hypothetical protein